jgi:hypothetical protein
MRVISAASSGSVVTALFLCLASCATPAAVRQFVTTARDATAKFAPFVNDIADSCIRRKMADRAVTEIADPTGLATAACKEDSDLAPQVLGAMNVLANYFNALNSLASNESVSYDKQIDDFAGKLQAAAQFPAPATDAVKGLAKFVVDAAGSAYQRKKLAEALKKADSDVTMLTDTLGRIVGVEYVRDLNNEEDTLKNRYRDAMRSNQHDGAIALLLQQNWMADLATLRKRKSAATDYQKVLERIRDGHKHLVSDASRWSAAELAKELGPYTLSIQSLAGSVQTAFF